MKYKVGDRVRIVNEHTSFMNPSGCADHWLGKTMTIIAITNKGLYKMREDKEENAGSGWVWGDREIACLICEEQVIPTEIIAIYRNGSETVAVRRHGHDTVKTAIAKCCPSDEYKFEFGAQLAYNRLMYGTDYHPAEVAFKKEEPDLYNGRVICTSRRGSFENKYTVGKIYEVKNGILIRDNKTSDIAVLNFSELCDIYCGAEWLEVVE